MGIQNISWGGQTMDVNEEWKNNFITEIDKTINRGNVDKETLEVMKELLKGAKARISMAEYFNEQEEVSE
jgi:hypothetical protein